MKNLLVVNASGRINRSITRRLTHQYAERWQEANPGGRVVYRDVGQNPPAPVNEAWIASAFSKAEQRSPQMRAALAQSEQLLNEIESATAIVFGVPMYNFGVPSALKAYFDQVIRVNRSFLFDPQAEEPYQPLLADKPTRVIVSVGDGSLLPGGEMETLNFLEPHLATMLNFIGLHSLEFVRVGYEEYQDHRLKQSLETAQASIDRMAVNG